MNKRLTLLLTLSLVGCAHGPDTRKTVQFPYAGELLKTIQAQSLDRAPASEPLEAKEEKSNRRIYFSSLYHQYATIGTHLGKSNDVAFCPQFHHDKVEADALYVPKIAPYGKGLIEDAGKDFFPELAFDKKISLNDYHETIREELLVLCDEGLSDNFYKFDNLVTHYANKKSFHMKPEAMESVLKIPIFANFYLIKMIRPQHEVSFSAPDEKKFIGLTQTFWFDRYVSEASAKRGGFLRNKMVRR